MKFGNQDKKENRNLLLFLTITACMTIGGIVRIFYLWLYPVPVRDAFTYRDFIEQWHQTGIIPEERGFPLLGLYILKMPQELFDCDIIQGGTGVNMVLGICIIALIMYISATIVPSTLIALCVGIIAATHPTLVDYSCQMTRENSFITFYALAILFFLKYLKSNQTWLLILISLFSAASVMCRHEGVELVLILGAFILLSRGKKLKERIKNAVFFWGLFVASFIAISAAIKVPFSYYKTYNTVFRENLEQES